MLKSNCLTCIIYFLCIIVMQAVTGSDDPDKKAIKEFYKNCEKPNTPPKQHCTACSWKWCAGIFGKNCVDKEKCTFAGAISENETHFEYFMLENTIDYDLRANESYSQLALLSPFLPLYPNQPGTPTCKPELRMSDFKFRYFLQIWDNKGASHRSRGITSGSTYKGNWAQQCQKLKEDYISRKSLGIYISGEYFAPLITHIADYADKNPEFSDGTKYNTSDGFLFLNFDKDRNCGGINYPSSSKYQMLYLALSFFVLHFSR